MRSIFTAISTIWTENTGTDRFVFLFHGIIWQLRKRLAHSFVMRLANGAKLKIYRHSAFSGAFYTRWIEKKDLLFIRAHANFAPTFVDVGANVGLFAASLFDKFSYFVLIEPLAACVRTLHETCALNPLVQSLIINAAVSDKPGVALFWMRAAFRRPAGSWIHRRRTSRESGLSQSKLWSSCCASVKRISS